MNSIHVLPEHNVFLLLVQFALILGLGARVVPLIAGIVAI